MNRSQNGWGGVQVALFFIVAAVFAFLIAKVLAFALHLVFVLLGYLIAFALAVVLLMWLWGRISGRSGGSRYDRGRDRYGRREF